MHEGEFVRGYYADFGTHPAANYQVKDCEVNRGENEQAKPTEAHSPA